MTGKVRARKDGSAVPLDDLDRKILAELAVHDPTAFAKLAETARAAGRA